MNPFLLCNHPRALFFAVSAMLFLLCCSGCDDHDKPMPRAERGRLDLSAWNMDRDGPVKLDGQWEFYWDRLLSPEDFRADPKSPEKPSYLVFPGGWKGVENNGRPLSGVGQATFRLRVVQGPGIREQVLRLFRIPAAYRLWANGELLAESGVVGTSAATETASRSLILATFAAEGDQLELVLQISNHHFRRGGVLDSIVLAAPGALERAHMRSWGWSLVLIGGLLLIGGYHFALYCFRQKNKSTLYFGLYCLVLAGYFISSDSTEWVIYLFATNLSPLLVDKFSFICYVCSASVLYRFYKSLYPKEFIVFIKWVCDIRSVLIILIVFVFPDQFVYRTIHYFMLSSFFLFASYFVLLIICLRRGYEGVTLLMLGLLLLGLSAINDLCYYFGVIKSVQLLKEGMFAFVMCQGLALAQRFSNAFTDVERLSLDLEGKNAALVEEMDERNRLEREIVNVSEEERRRLSHDLHDGLCQQLSSARVRCAVLARQTLTQAGVGAEMSELYSLLEESVSQAYDLSRGLWPVEHDPQGAGPSLEELARQVSESSGIAVTFSQGLACVPCVNQHMVQLYRIAQEAVANAAKHAKPSLIHIALDCGTGNRLTLEVRDNGIGWGRAARPTKGGLGLRIMAHRARIIGAELRVADACAGGTVVTCRLLCQDVAPSGDGKT